MTLATSKKSNSRNGVSFFSDPPIWSLRTFDIFRGAPLSRAAASTDSPWSLQASYYQGRILDGVHLPSSTHQQDESEGCLSYIKLPTAAGLPRANLTIVTDRYGHTYFDPTVGMSSRRSGSRNGSTLSTKSGVLSLLQSCALIGVIGDAAGKERVAAFGKPGRASSGSERENGDEEGQTWSPGWMVLSEVLAGGTVERYLEERKIDQGPYWPAELLSDISKRGRLTKGVRTIH
jgi:hypothetical protein